VSFLPFEKGGNERLLLTPPTTRLAWKSPCSTTITSCIKAHNINTTHSNADTTFLSTIFLEGCLPDLDFLCGPNTTTTTTRTMDVNNSSSSSNNSNNPQHIPRAVNQWAGSAGRAFTSFAQNITTRRYTLPDKSVASQVLMYRQLLHTKCRPGLKLSRDYQGTPAQKAVLHMPVR